jgi:hypothetical protein
VPVPVMERLEDVDDYCTKCHTTKLLSPAMKLLVSACCHRMCGPDCGACPPRRR